MRVKRLLSDGLSVTQRIGICEPASEDMYAQTDRSCLLADRCCMRACISVATYSLVPPSLVNHTQWNHVCMHPGLCSVSTCRVYMSDEEFQHHASANSNNLRHTIASLSACWIVGIFMSMSLTSCSTIGSLCAHLPRADHAYLFHDHQSSMHVFSVSCRGGRQSA